MSIETITFVLTGGLKGNSGTYCGCKFVDGECEVSLAKDNMTNLSRSLLRNYEIVPKGSENKDKNDDKLHIDNTGAGSGGTTGVGGGEAVTKLREAMATLDPNNDEHWINNGKPAIAAVEEAAGRSDLKRSDLEEAWPELTRTNTP